MRRSVKIGLALGLGSVAVVAIAALNIGAIVRYATTPGAPFADEAPPAAPDYADPAAWSALPDREDAADAVPAGQPVREQLAAPADVFYVHPTTYVGARWNAPADDPALNDATDRVATRIQASAFNDCCAVYAPRYRQAGPSTFTQPTSDGDLAFDLAYDDVRRAWSAFEARRGAERPFVLAAHSQGAMLAERLLVDEISGTPRRDRLVAAYLIGGTLTVDGLRERAPDLAPCESPTDLHCVVAWNARIADYQEGPFAIARPDTRERLCTNPLSWRPDGAHVPADQNLGAVFLDDDDHSVRPAFADARCVDGTLVIGQIGAAPRDLPSQILDHVLGAGNYHAIEYQIFYMNLRDNVGARVAAMQAR